MSKKITYAKVENFKGIKALEVDNLNRFVGIFGANGAGKSSFIEAIQNAIKLAHNGNSKVTYGEEKGSIEVHFGDEFKIKRIIGKGGKLEVEVAGAKITRPQSWLDDIFKGAIGDPHKFINLPQKERVRYILSTYGKEEAYDALESQRADLFDQRTEMGRKKRSKEEEVKQVDTSIFEDLTDAPDTSALEKELDQANTHNRGYYDLINRKEKGENYLQAQKNDETRYDTKITSLDDEIAELQRKIDDKKEEKRNTEDMRAKAMVQVEKAETALNDINGQIEAFDKKDTQALKAQLTEAREADKKNIELRTKQSIHEQDIAKMEQLQVDRKELDDQVHEIEDQQNALLSGINTSYQICVKDGVMMAKVNEAMVAIDDLNTATQIDLALDVMLAGPNEYKIITIENANSLDPAMMEKVKAKIEKAQGQCFLETVYKTGYETITIENGENI